MKSELNLIGTLTLPLSVTLAKSTKERIDELYRLADDYGTPQDKAEAYARLASKLFKEL